MNRFYEEFFRFLEANKDRFIDGNTNLTPEQKTEIKELLNKYPKYEKAVLDSLPNKDWNKAKTVDYDFFTNGEKTKKVYEDIKIKAELWDQKNLSMEAGRIPGIELGKDYRIINVCEYNGSKVVAYQPLTYKGSITIASDADTPPKNSSLPDELKLKDSSGIVKTRAQWCTAYDWTPDHWNSHIKYEEVFIYICGLGLPSIKIALDIKKSGTGAAPRDYNNVLFTYKLNDKFYFNLFGYNDKLILPVGTNIYSYPHWCTNPATFDNFGLGEIYKIVSKEKMLEAYNIFREVAFGEHQTQELSTMTTSTTTTDEAGEETTNEIINISDPSFRLNLRPYIQDGKLTKRFGVVACDFIVDELPLKSLEGCPTEVGGNFIIKRTEITSLEHAPTKVGKDCVISYNPGLTSLKHAPETVGRNFVVNDNSLISLEGGPQNVGGIYNCAYNRLTTLKGAPDQINKSFYCVGNKAGDVYTLTSLKHAPMNVGLTFDCSYNGITSLEYAPHVGMSFICNECRELRSLKGVQDEINQNFECNNTSITDLKHGPKKVGGDFFCVNCNLSSLEGMPITVGCTFDCSRNDLFNLDGIKDQKRTVGKFVCKGNNIKATKKDFHRAINTENVQI